MSHTRIMKMKIKNANRAVLMTAMNALMLHLEGTQVSVIDIWQSQGTTAQVMFGIKAPGMTKGYGVNINDKGEITIVGDEYRQRVRQQQFAGLVNQYYQTAAITKALENMNYGTRVKAENGKMLVMGVSA